MRKSRKLHWLLVIKFTCILYIKPCVYLCEHYTYTLHIMHLQSLNTHVNNYAPANKNRYFRVILNIRKNLISLYETLESCYIWKLNSNCESVYYQLQILIFSIRFHWHHIFYSYILIDACIFSLHIFYSQINLILVTKFFSIIEENNRENC